ncbi:hypothetical protein EHV15_34095 [Paenibacillus oralis]|uniref:Uncharacterized protein n=1 Tax=Paenibacillus oralis TaxID=2490856 RepID=A0A3P3T9E8_9BACL|nr:hypothetical protein [Paenibacillus oralis]RRJ54630.1 hypothetical protein EHV15_34095 [Paenibacillus oralis]
MPKIHCRTTGEIWECDRLKPLQNVISVRIVETTEAQNRDDFEIIEATEDQKQKLNHHIGRCLRFSKQFYENELRYVFCEDWFIYAKDRCGKLYFINTELWHNWADLSEEQQDDEKAVEKYMLPIARKNWNSLRWIRADENHFSEVSFLLLRYPA